MTIAGATCFWQLFVDRPRSELNYRAFEVEVNPIHKGGFIRISNILEMQSFESSIKDFITLEMRRVSLFHSSKSTKGVNCRWKNDLPI